MELTAALFDLCSSVPRPIIAIDGAAGAGKTTLAAHLSSALSLKYSCTTVHMDSLYNGWHSPFDSHLTDALTLACACHQESQKFSLTHFDWKTSEYGSPVEIPQSQLLILEGVGSSQSSIRPYLSASIWIDIDPSVGFDRVISRDGEVNSKQMQEWLVQQAEHFRENNSESAADFVLTTS